MKKIIYIAIFIISLLFSCNNNEKVDNSKNEKNYIFLNTVSISKSGDYVLAPTGKNVDSLLNGNENLLFVFYPRQVLKNEKNNVIVDEYGDSVKIPASLVIDFDKNKKAVKGDVVLTWWQKATGMQRAMVLNSDSSLTPWVYYLDVSSLPPKNEMQFMMNTDTLLPNSFKIIQYDSISSGLSFATKDDKKQFYIVVKATQDSVLGLSWAGSLKVFGIDECVFANPPDTLEVGEMVLVPYVGNYHPAEITQIWSDIGKIRVNVFLLDTFFDAYANICDIIPKMEK